MAVAQLFKYGKTLLLSAAYGVAIASAYADFPDKTITLVVPFSAGGPTDKIARDLAESMRKTLKQTIVVDNVVGAGGTIGTAKVVRAVPDGYTLLVHHTGLSTAGLLYKNLGYKPDDLEFLGLINDAPSVLIAKPSLPAKDFAEFRKLATENKDLNMANAGAGSASHLCGLLLQDALKTQMTFVPYKGTAPAMTDLMGGQVDVMCEQATNATPQIEAKKVKVYGITSSKRATAPVLAQIPTLSDVGLKGFNFSVWHGLYAPKGTPPEVLNKLNTALRYALKDQELVKRQEALGIAVIADVRQTPQEHKKFFNTEVVRWTKVFVEAGIQPE
jgi:tripartite-type tricarboxylate transporter receptor subunit TctC